jgi:hypothetical protein
MKLGHWVGFDKQLNTFICTDNLVSMEWLKYAYHLPQSSSNETKRLRTPHIPITRFDHESLVLGIKGWDTPA